MKKILSVILSVIIIICTIMCFDFSAFAIESVNCGKNVVFSFDEETGSISISGNGKLYKNGKSIMVSAENDRYNNAYVELDEWYEEESAPIIEKIKSIEAKGYYHGTYEQYQIDLKNAQKEVDYWQQQYDKALGSSSSASALVTIKAKLDDAKAALNTLKAMYSRTQSLQIQQSNLDYLNDLYDIKVSTIENTHKNNLRTIDAAVTYHGVAGSKKYNPITANGKRTKIKYKYLKSSSQYVQRKKVISIKKAKGRVTYKKLKGNKKIKVDKYTGNITVKKGLKKGYYSVTVKVTATGNKAYKKGTKKVIVTIIVE